MAWDFLEMIPDSHPLYKIIVPGSHDAGVYKGSISQAGIPVPRGFAICQSEGLGGQCRTGSRFFDLRIALRAGQYRAHHTSFGGYVGVLGGDLESMMKELVNFLKDYESEFLIVRFTKCTGPLNDIVEIVKNVCGSCLYKESCSIAHRRLGELRGKIVAIFDNDFDNVDPFDGIHKFHRNDTLGPGLAIIGKYANTSDVNDMQKKQLKKIETHTNSFKRNEVRTDNFIDYSKTLNHLAPRGHLYQVYMTQTSGFRNIEKMTTTGAHRVARDMLKNLSDKFEDSAILFPNIILYDFVNSRTSRQIINLNTKFLFHHNANCLVA